MEYAEVKEWLDKLVANIIETESLYNFNEQIRVCRPGLTIHMFTGIDIVADVMGLELREDYEEDKDFPYRYSFEYKGNKFIQIEEERLESFVHM